MACRETPSARLLTRTRTRRPRHERTDEISRREFLQLAAGAAALPENDRAHIDTLENSSAAPQVLGYGGGRRHAAGDAAHSGRTSLSRKAGSLDRAFCGGRSGRHLGTAFRAMAFRAARPA